MIHIRVPRFLFNVSLTLFLGLGVVSLQMPRRDQLSTKLSLPQLHTQLRLLEAQLKLSELAPTFGFGNLYGNWFFLQYLLYFGDDELRELTGYRLVTNFSDIIIGRDPGFITAYAFLSTGGTIFAGRPAETIAIMRSGVERITPAYPRAYFPWFYIAQDEFLFMGNVKDAKQSYLNAADWAAQAVPGDQEARLVNKRASQTATWLATNPDSREAQIGAWVSVLQFAFDSTSRRYAVLRIQRLGGVFTRTPDGRTLLTYPTTP